MTSSSHGSNGFHPGRRAPVFDTEDAWRLDDDDEGDVTGDAGADVDRGIARVAAQAGLGRIKTASASSLSVASGRAGSFSSNPNLNVASPSSVSSVAGSYMSVKPPQLKERGRQSSYGFWERLSGFGVGSSSSTANGSSSSLNLNGKASADDAAAEASGYTRFNDQLELEDNFDGTYSVATSVASSSTLPGNAQGKLMAPASISPLGAAGARNGGKIPQTSSTAAASSLPGKGKTRLVDSPGSATVIGNPRPKSPFTRGKRSEKPRDDEDMLRFVRKDIEDVMEGEQEIPGTNEMLTKLTCKTDPVNLLKTLSLSSAPCTAPENISAIQSFPSSSDYYTLTESPPVLSASTFPYDPDLIDQSPDAAGTAVELAKSQAQARRDATRREKFIECLKKDTVDIGEDYRYHGKAFKLKMLFRLS